MKHYAIQEEDKLIIKHVLDDKHAPENGVEIDPSELPPRDVRAAWAIVDGKVVVAEDKAVECRREATRRKRAAEYPSIGDQLDALMKWLSTETEFGIPAELKSLACKCMAVKSKYPLD